MSANVPCTCPKVDMRGSPRLRHWWVLQRRSNHSAFNGYHYTPSDYSSVQCRVCMGVWRTKAKYVQQLPDRPSDG